MILEANNEMVDNQDPLQLTPVTTKARPAFHSVPRKILPTASPAQSPNPDVVTFGDLSTSKCKKRSPIWAFFDKCSEENDKATCKVCGSKLSTKNGVTTNMAVHLRNYHKEQYEKYNEKASEKLIAAKKRKLEDAIKKEEREANQPSVKCFVHTVDPGFDLGPLRYHHKLWGTGC